MAPVWEQLKSAVPQNAGIMLKDVNANDPEMQKHQIQGFPTIRLFPKGMSSPTEYIDYRGERAVPGIIEFLKSGGRQ
jgi:hypothetical protein